MKNFLKLPIQFFADGEPAPSTTNTEPTPKIDYQAKYNETLAEIERLKNSITNINAENAEYKRKEKAKMTEEEKKAQEYQEQQNAMKELQEKIAGYELRETLSNNGFSADEIKILTAKNCAPEAYAEIYKTREEALRKSLNAGAIANANAANNVGVGNTNSNTKSDFAKFQEEQQKTEKSGRIEF